MGSIQPHISIFDKSFSEEKTSDYCIYLELSINAVTYTIFNPQTSSFIGIEKYLFNDIYNDFSLVEPLKRMLSVSTILQKEFKLFNVAYVNQRATLIPNAIFNNNELKEYHHFNFSPKEEDLFFSDKLINLSGYNVYSIPDFITELFKTKKNIRFNHFSSALIESSILQAKKNKTKLLINVHLLPSSFQIVVVKNELLEIYNSFSYQTSEDFIYYLLFVLNQLNINPDEASIILTGEVDKNSAIYEMVYKYIQKIDFGKRPADIKFSYIFEEIPQHYYYALFNQYLCE